MQRCRMSMPDSPCKITCNYEYSHIKKSILVKCLLGPRTSSPSLEVHEITRTTDLAVGQDFAGAHDLVIEEEEDEEEYSGMTEYPQYTIKEYSENGENYGKGGKGSFQSGPVVSLKNNLSTKMLTLSSVFGRIEAISMSSNKYP